MGAQFLSALDRKFKAARNSGCFPEHHGRHSPRAILLHAPELPLPTGNSAGQPGEMVRQGFG